MNPWIEIDRTAISGGSETLRLMRRGEDFSIMLGRIELMNSRMSGSEKALASAACAKLENRQRPKILIGGLGMGFTLRAALAELGPGAAISVAELVPAVVTWAKGPLAGLFGDSLSDPRVSLHEADVADLIASARNGYDAILLDVDNGPDGLTSAANDRLYAWAGLAAARRALRPGGILAVWSSGPDRDFSHRLRDSGFTVEELRVRAHGKSGARHVIWIATAALDANRARGRKR